MKKELIRTDHWNGGAFEEEDEKDEDEEEI